MLETIIKKIDKNKTIDLNLELRKKENLKDDDILFLATYMNINNIAQIRDSYDIKKSDSSVSEFVKEYFDNIRNNNFFDKSLDKIYIDLTKISIITAIRNNKYFYSLIDLISYGYEIVVEFRKKYYDKLIKIYEYSSLKEIFRIYCTIKQLLMQIKYEKEEYNKNIAFLVYLKIQLEIFNGTKLDDILKNMDIDYEYYYNLQKMFDILEIEKFDEIEL